MPAGPPLIGALNVQLNCSSPTYAIFNIKMAIHYQYSLQNIAILMLKMGYGLRSRPHRPPCRWMSGAWASWSSFRAFGSKLPGRKCLAVIGTEGEPPPRQQASLSLVQMLGQPRKRWQIGSGPIISKQYRPANPLRIGHFQIASSRFGCSRTDAKRPAISWMNCQATRPERAPRVTDHSTASAWSFSVPIGNLASAA